MRDGLKQKYIPENSPQACGKNSSFWIRVQKHWQDFMLSCFLEMLLDHHGLKDASDTWILFTLCSDLLSCYTSYMTEGYIYIASKSSIAFYIISEKEIIRLEKASLKNINFLSKYYLRCFLTIYFIILFRWLQGVLHSSKPCATGTKAGMSTLNISEKNVQ